MEALVLAKNHSFLDSSFIQSISFCEDTDTLMIYFKTGSVWFYYDVPEEIYLGLTNASSLGRYFNTFIRNIFSSEKLSYHQDLKILPINV